MALTHASSAHHPEQRLITHHTSVVLEVQVDTVGATPGLALADDNGGHDLLAELGLSLLDGGHDHVTDTGSGETVEAGTDTSDGNDVQVAGTGVVAAVHHGATIRKEPLVSCAFGCFVDSAVQSPSSELDIPLHVAVRDLSQISNCALSSASRGVREMNRLDRLAFGVVFEVHWTEVRYGGRNDL